MQDEELKIRSTGCAIDISTLDCPPINTLNVTGFMHRDYPGCSFDIAVQYVVCDPPQNGFDGLYADNYYITGHNCPQYQADLQASALQGDAALIAFVEDFSGPVLEELVFQLSLLDPNNSFDCNGENFTVNWVKSQCTAVCINDYGEFSSHRTFNCANTGCCFSVSELCIDDDGVPEVITISLPTQQPANCNDGSPLTPASGPGGLMSDPGQGSGGDGPSVRCTYITDCQFTCS